MPRDDDPAARELERTRRADLVAEPDEPPVAARLVIEIRTDGTRTIARGALEDATAGETVAIKVEGTTPFALAAALARSIFNVPFFARTFARAAATALLTGKKGPEGK
ncbi:MAG TPA: hypothetical protein VGQ83_35610 [Polyangia bacterium]|jgi:hypothetical protein